MFAVTVNITDFADVVDELLKVKEGIDKVVPLPGQGVMKPVHGYDQVYPVPVTPDVSVTVWVVPPEQMNCEGGEALTSGTGYISTEYG